MPNRSNQAFFRNTLPADLEAIAAIASMGALEPFAGFAGMAGASLPGPAGQGADWVRKIQSLGYEPSNPESLQQLGSALKVPLEAYEKGTNWLGDRGEDIAGPIGGAIGKTLPEIIGAGFGARQLLKHAPSSPNLPSKPQSTPLAQPDIIDPSRRKFLKQAGIGGAGLAAISAIPGKSMLSLVDTIPAKAAVTVAKVPIPKLSHFDYHNVNLLKVLAPEKSGPRFTKFLDRMESGNLSSAERSFFADNDLSPLSVQQAAVNARKGKVHLDPEETNFGSSINDRDPVSGIPRSTPDPEGSRLLGPFPEDAKT